MTRVRACAVVVFSLGLAACSRRAGHEFECRWVPDPVAQVDLRDEAQVQHLLDDIRVAEELAVRYGDRMGGARLVETLGIVSRHGGVKDRALGRQSRQRCLATLFGVIASTHRIAVSDIGRVRPRLAERGVDLPVTIPVALLLIGAVIRFTRWIRSRFEPDERVGWLVATLLASLIIPAVVVALGGLWAAGVEIVRLGNEHVGNRVRIGGLRTHALVVLVLGIAAVWIASGVARTRSRQASPGQRAA